MFDRANDIMATAPCAMGRILRATAAGALLGLAMPVMAANEAQPPDVSASPQGYQADRALCISGLSHQARADCLREAAAASQAARRGMLDDQGAQYQHNALQRCDALPAQARDDCRARMRGEGTMVEGSVEEGGIYRERRELIPAPDPARPPAGAGAAD